MLMGALKISHMVKYQTLTDEGRGLDMYDWSFMTFTCYGWGKIVPKSFCSKFLSPRIEFKVQRTLLSLMSSLELWRTLEVPDWSLMTWTWYGSSKGVSNNFCAKFHSSGTKIKVQITLFSLELWRILEVPDRTLMTRTWYGWGQGVQNDICYKF